MNEPTIRNVDDPYLIALMRAANGRIVFVAPGVSPVLAQELGAAWQRLGKDRVSVVLDADPAACRIGYGTEEGLKHLHDVASGLGVTCPPQPGPASGSVIWRWIMEGTFNGKAAMQRGADHSQVA